MTFPFQSVSLLLALALMPCCAPHKNPPAGPDKPAIRKIAVNAAITAYKLPDLDVAFKYDRLGDFEKSFKCFTNAEWLADYRIYHAEYDPVSGYKTAIFEPLGNDPEKPWILAFSGTDSFQHWISDAHFATDQIEELAGLRKKFTEPGYKGRNGRPLHRQNLLIAGHSLGGGLSEANAYLIKKDRIARHNSAKVMVVSFNGFGAGPVIRRHENRKKPWDPWSEMPADYAANYFHPRDLASEIGDHYGPTYPLGPVRPFFSFRIPYHSMENLADQEKNHSGGEIQPGAILDASWLTPVMWLTEVLDYPLTQISRFFANTGGMPNSRLLTQAIHRRHLQGLSPENLRVYEAYLRFSAERLLYHNLLYLPSERRALETAVADLPKP